MAAVYRLTCTATNTHGLSHEPLFRILHLNSDQSITAGVTTDLQFTLDYHDVSFHGSRDWISMTWDRIVETHGAKVHVNIVSASGIDFYHVHARHGGGVTLVVNVCFQRPGRHLIAVTWAVETNSLGLCTDEYVPHAHGVQQRNDDGVYPLLEHQFTVDVLDRQPAPPSQPLPLNVEAGRSAVCMKQAALLSAAPNAERLGWMGFDSSYALAESTSCCACAAGADAPLISWSQSGASSAMCEATTASASTVSSGVCATGGGCLAMSARAWPLGSRPPTASVLGSMAEFAVGQCLAVELAMSDALTGDPVTLGPYLGAAAHLFIVSEAEAQWPLAKHDHAYATIHFDRLDALSRQMCDDMSMVGTYPMPMPPEVLGPTIYALVRLPHPGAWRMYASVRRGGTLATAAFGWTAADPAHTPLAPPAAPLPVVTPGGAGDAETASCGGGGPLSDGSWWQRTAAASTVLPPVSDVGGSGGASSSSAGGLIVAGLVLTGAALLAAVLLGVKRMAQHKLGDYRCCTLATGGAAAVREEGPNCRQATDAAEASRAPPQTKPKPKQRGKAVELTVVASEPLGSSASSESEHLPRSKDEQYMQDLALLHRLGMLDRQPA